MLSRRQRLAGTAIFSLTLAVLLADRAAYADCSAVGDVVTCDDVGADNSPYNAGAGNNTIDIVSGTYADAINGNVGDDIFNASGGQVGALNGNQDNDTFFLTGTSVTGDVSGGAGDDSILLDGSIVDGIITGNAGADQITLNAGSAGGVNGGVGSDFILLDGATVVNDILGGADADFIGLMSGSVGGDVLGEAGDDTLALQGASVAGSLLGEAGNDTVVVVAGAVGGDLSGGGGDDLLGIASGSVTGSLLGGAGDDSLLLFGGEVGGNLEGNAGDDFILTQGATVVGNAEGGAGDDTVVLASGEIGGFIDGGDGDDLLAVQGGFLAGDLLGGLGNDGIVVGLPDGSGNASIAGNIDGGDGDDLMLLTAAEAVDGSVLGGAGNDVVGIFGAQMTETIPILIGGVSEDFTGGNFDAQLGNLASLEGGDGFDALVFVGIDGGLPAAVEGWEFIQLADNTVLNVHQNTADMTFTDNLLLQIDGTSTLLAAGQSPGVLNIPGDVFNAGVISMVDGEANDRVNIGGNYSGGGALAFDAALDASEAADFVSIGGNVGAASAVTVNDVGNGVGALTGDGPGNGIALIEVAGLTTASDFALSGGPLQVGVFSYDLSLEGDNVWYLQSSLLEQGYIYGALPGAMLAAQKNIMGSLYERVGDVRQVLGGAQLNEDPLWLGGASGVWLRGLGNWATHEGELKVGSSSIQTSYQQDLAAVQIGADFDLTGNLGLGADEGSAVLGISGIYGRTWVHADDETGNKVADWDSNIYGLGVTGTWYMPNGLYADLAGQVLWYDGTVSTVAGGDKADVDGFGWGVGAEVGYAIPVTRHVQVVPNGQITYQRVNFDDFTDSDGVSVSRDKGQSLEGRLGVIVEAAMRPGRGTWFSTYVEGNIVHEFLDATRVEAAGTSLGYDMKGTAAEIGIGASVRVMPSLSFYAEVDYQIPFEWDDGTRALQATGGLRFAF